MYYGTIVFFVYIIATMYTSIYSHRSKIAELQAQNEALRASGGHPVCQPLTYYCFTLSNQRTPTHFYISHFGRLRGLAVTAAAFVTQDPKTAITGGDQVAQLQAQLRVQQEELERLKTAKDTKSDAQLLVAPPVAAPPAIPAAPPSIEPVPKIEEPKELPPPPTPEARRAIAVPEVPAG